MIASQIIMDIPAVTCAPVGKIASFKAVTDRKVNRWKTNALRPATSSNSILIRNTGSYQSAAALVIKSNKPEGTINNKALLDQGSKCRANNETGRFFENPSKRRSNIMAGPTSKAIPVICTISRIG